MIYFTAVFLVVLPIVSGQSLLWEQCKLDEHLNDKANEFRRWISVDWAKDMCIWVVLYLL